MTNYKKQLEELYSLKRFAIKLGLRNIKALLKELGNPHKSLKVIHVGGTNGKGSVCSMLKAILIEAGYKVGMYTSPHLLTVNERIQVNNKYVSKREIFELMKITYPKVKRLRSRGIDVTFFECLTAMAFYYFKKKSVDICVIEVGLGGRLDATNVFEPLISIITNVSLEHTKHLGNTITKIAGEKAGIIKRSKPVVTACKRQALKVIKAKCKKTRSKLMVVKDTQDYETNLYGEHQKINMSVAVAAIKHLVRTEKLNVTEQQIRRGLKKVQWLGRLEIARETPKVLLDVAHNAAGIRSLKKALTLFKYKQLILVVGISSDKKLSKMLSLIVPLANQVILTRAEWRGADTKRLERWVKKIDPNKNIAVRDKVADAVKYGIQIAKRGDLVCMTGSIFSVGEAKAYLLKNEKN